MDLNKQHNNFSKLELASNSIEKQFFINENYDHITIQNLSLTGHVFRRCDFTSSKFYNCKFINCEFIMCTFNKATLFGVEFIKCTFTDCSFANSEMQDFKFIDVTKSNCDFKNINIINNVVGIFDEDNNIISDSKPDKIKKLDENISPFLIKLNNLDPANNFIKSENEYKIEDHNTALVIVKDPEFGDNVWRIMIYNNENDSLISDTVKDTISIEDLQSIIFDICEIAKTKTNDLFIIASINNIMNRINLTDSSILNETKIFNHQNDLNDLKRYIDQKFDMLLQILNMKLK